MFKVLPRALAEKDVWSLTHALHGIADPKEKKKMVLVALWETLAPIHGMNEPRQADEVMRRLWKAALLKSTFGLGAVENRLREFTTKENPLLEAMPAEGIGLMEYLLNPEPDTFDRAITEARSRLSHGRRTGDYQIIVLKKLYPRLFTKEAAG